MIVGEESRLDLEDFKGSDALPAVATCFNASLSAAGEVRLNPS